ncbi:MAG: DCC1-like thiol-disulfide oxidoreductase family protein [Gaiellaceae bacterium]
MLLYDDSCRLCRFAARCVVRLDRRQELAFLPLQDEAATPLLAAVPAGERLDTWRLASTDGSLSGFGAGAPALFRATRLTRPLGLLLGAIPGALLERCYELIARNRGILGRIAPEGPAPRRYP